MTKLLINEPPLQVLPSLAVSLGLNEAIFIQQLHYLLNNPKIGVERDGHKWVFFTYDEWKEAQFPFWSTSTIQRIVLGLEDKKLVVSARFDEKQYDQRKYYRLDYNQLDALDDIKLTRSDDTTLTRSLIGNTESTSENTADVFPEPTPTKKLGDLVDGVIALSQSPGIKRQARIDAILSATAEKLRVRTTGKRWEEFAKLADDRQQNFGEPLGVFLDWLVSQKGFNPQFWPPNRMAEFWPQAFVGEAKKVTGRSAPEIK